MRQEDVCVVLDGTRYPHNISAVVRTCDAVGIADLRFINTTVDTKVSTLLNSAARGSDKWVRAETFNDRAKLLTDLKNEGKKVVATRMDGMDFREYDWTEPFALVLGEETNGVSRETTDMADAAVSIPMYGMVESFNVSVANGILLYEMHRQRQLKGMYDEMKHIDDQLLFEHALPKVAQILRESGRKYPKLVDGEFLFE